MQHPIIDRQIDKAYAALAPQNLPSHRKGDKVAFGAESTRGQWLARIQGDHDLVPRPTNGQSERN